MTESNIEKTQGALSSAGELIKQAQALREEASTAEGKFRDVLLQIASGLEQSAMLINPGLGGARGEN